MDGLALDIPPPAAAAHAAGWPIPFEAAGPMIAYAILGLALIVLADMAMLAWKTKR